MIYTQDISSLSHHMQHCIIKHHIYSPVYKNMKVDGVNYGPLYCVVVMDVTICSVHVKLGFNGTNMLSFLQLDSVVPVGKI